MSDDYAAQTPVETIHSGPAASAMGGKFLSGIQNALVLDVGGTTTDLALIIDGKVTISEEGASVAGYKTSVKAANLQSIGLGGDSHIRINRDGKLTIGPRRVVPLAYLAMEYPKLKEQMRTLSKLSWERSSPEWLEYWYLIREPERANIIQTERQAKVVELLSNGPYPLPDLLKKLGILHISQFDTGELFNQEIVGRAGLTPTDLLHIDGRYNAWDGDASHYALRAFSKFQFKDPDEMVELIWKEISEMIIRTVVEFLSEFPVPNPQSEKQFGHWFFENSVYNTNPHLQTLFQLSHPIIGIGGPASMFLEKVAETLHADLELPNYYRVANAVGAIAGSIMIEEEILVYPRLSHAGLDVLGYYIQTSKERTLIEDLDDALDFARKKCREKAISSALQAGADHPEVSMHELSDGIDTYRIRAQAMGKPRLSGA